MLITRIITALVLLAILLPILFLGSPLAIIIVCAVFFAAAAWESLRLFGYKLAPLATVAWTVVFVWLAHDGITRQFVMIWAIASLAWLVRFIPTLKIGLPSLHTVSNRLYSTLYLVSVLGCFLAILVMQQHSPVYLLSVMAIVWVADIGAYFWGRAVGRHKLAPQVSPGKSWEGAIGGWFSVLIVAGLSTLIPQLSDSFSSYMLHLVGWSGLVLVLTVLTAASVLGDLVESQLKRRAQVKDSSQLLPGHGGVLDRIDALIPVLPLAMLIQYGIGLLQKS